MGRFIAGHIRSGLVLRAAEPGDRQHHRAELPDPEEPEHLSEGTGLNDPVSDIVGRTRVRYGRLIDITHRYRIDKDNFAVRRNEVDLTVGTQQTYAQIGYLRLNRDIDPTIEDLRDKEGAARRGPDLVPASYWSIFGATVIDLTDTREDPLSWPTASSPFATAWASSMRMIASCLASPGGVTMSGSAPSAKEAQSAFTWHSRGLNR